MQSVRKDTRGITFSWAHWGYFLGRNVGRLFLSTYDLTSWVRLYWRLFSSPNITLGKGNSGCRTNCTSKMGPPTWFYRHASRLIIYVGRATADVVSKLYWCMSVSGKLWLVVVPSIIHRCEKGRRKGCKKGKTNYRPLHRRPCQLSFLFWCRCCRHLPYIFWFVIRARLYFTLKIPFFPKMNVISYLQQL